MIHNCNNNILRWNWRICVLCLQMQTCNSYWLIFITSNIHLKQMNPEHIKAYKLAVFEILGDFSVLPYIACPRYPYIRVYRLYDNLCSYWAVWHFKEVAFVIAVIKGMKFITVDLVSCQDDQPPSWPPFRLIYFDYSCLCKNWCTKLLCGNWWRRDG